MMKNIFLLLFVLILSTKLFAQVNKNPDIEGLKINYIQQKLSLSDKEAAKFWPIYKLWQSKEHLLRKNRNSLIRFKSADEIQAMSDESINQSINTELQQKLQIIQLERYYITKIRAILPPKKVVALYSAQESFKRELLHRYQSFDKDKDKDRN